MHLTDAHRELLEDKFVLWDRASRQGPHDLRDYNRRAADALKAALSICAGCNCATPDGGEAVHGQVVSDRSRDEPKDSLSGPTGEVGGVKPVAWRVTTMPRGGWFYVDPESYERNSPGWLELGWTLTPLYAVPPSRGT